MVDYNGLENRRVSPLKLKMRHSDEPSVQSIKHRKSIDCGAFLVYMHLVVKFAKHNLAVMLPSISATFTATGLQAAKKM